MNINLIFFLHKNLKYFIFPNKKPVIVFVNESNPISSIWVMKSWKKPHTKAKIKKEYKIGYWWIWFRFSEMKFKFSNCSEIVVNLKLNSIVVGATPQNQTQCRRLHHDFFPNHAFIPWNPVSYDLPGLFASSLWVNALFEIVCVKPRIWQKFF